MVDHEFLSLESMNLLNQSFPSGDFESVNFFDLKSFHYNQAANEVVQLNLFLEDSFLQL